MSGHSVSPSGQIGADFTAGSIPKLLLRFALPILLAQLLGSAYNMTDLIIIGQFVGRAGTVAVTMGGKLLLLLTNISTGLASGGQICISHHLGEHGHDACLRTHIGTLLSGTMLAAIGFSVLSYTLSPQILRLLQTPAEALDGACTYLRIISFGIPLLFGYNAIASALNGMGDSIRPLILIGAATVVNLTLDLILVGWVQLGITGAAIATVIGQGTAFLASIFILYRGRARTGFDFHPSAFRIHLPCLRQMLRIGVPIAGSQSLTTISQIVVVGFVNRYGLVAAAAYGIADKIVSLLNIASNSMKNASASVIGQNYGAKQYSRVHVTLRTALRYAVPVALLLSVLSLLFPQAFFRLFTPDADVLAMASSLMVYAPAGFLLSSVLCAYGGATIGLGRSDLVFLSGVMDSVVCRLLFCWLFGSALHMGISGFFLGNAIARLGPISIDMLYYYFGGWQSGRKARKSTGHTPKT